MSTAFKANHLVVIVIILKFEVIREIWCPSNWPYQAVHDDKSDGGHTRIWYYQI